MDEEEFYEEFGELEDIDPSDLDLPSEETEDE